tara:strand:- start:1241 stop:1423 length:183 start_codon:yes stop_codon:yes gene_type:complete
MKKKELEDRIEQLETKLAQANDVVQFILNVVHLWRNKKIGNLRGINTISKIFVEKEKKSK